MKNRKSRSYSFSTDFIKDIGDLSEETGVPASQMIERACYAKYPELTIRRIDRQNQNAKPLAFNKGKKTKTKNK